MSIACNVLLYVRICGILKPPYGFLGTYTTMTVSAMSIILSLI